MNKIRIKSDGTPTGTEVTVEGVRVEGVTSIKWEMKDCNSVGIVTLTLICDEIEVEGFEECQS